MADVFISYSRKDQEFVRTLYQALQQHQLQAWVDWEGIPPSAEWLHEIFAAIDQADTFLFVISPDSVASRVCNQEVEHAVQRNKRLVPVVCRDTDPELVPASIAQRNWIYFREGDDFQVGLDALVRAVNTDLDWVHTHTRLLVRALEWESKRRDNSLLLRGSDLREAELWLSQAVAQKDITPTTLHTQYIFACRRAESMPTGTVTFLFTEVEDSSKLWEQNSTAMRTMLARHDALLRAAVETNGGQIFAVANDGFRAVFNTAPEALAAALSAQLALLGENWHEQGLPSYVRVSMALHTGAAEARDGGYFGPSLDRAARLLSAGHGGQILLSGAVQELLPDNLPQNVTLLDLGEHRLRDLRRSEHIFQVVAPNLPAEFPPLKTLNASPNNLPVQTSPFIGREKEVAAAQQRLLQPDVRLLTLTGPGGIGKTRLSLQVAAELLDTFEDGVFFVPLADVSDPDLIIAAIARAIGVKETEDHPALEDLQNYLRDKHLLLLLDNFEQIVESSHQIADLLSVAPRLKVLATSRSALRIKAEREFPVPTLGLPDPKQLPNLETLSQYEAVALFIQRAQAVKPDFVLTDQNALAVAKICSRLDGLPLAIELAAARVKVLTPQAMLPKLESTLKLLVGGARDLPARQQTLRGAIDWSHNLLDLDEQRLFRRLSIFTGGFTLESAEMISNYDNNIEIDVLDGIGALIEENLLRQEEQPSGESRFGMLQIIGEYATEQLVKSGEAEMLRTQHADFFLNLAESAEAELSGPQQEEWIEKLDVELGNLRSAIARSMQNGQPEIAGRIATALWRFMWTYGYLTEGRRWLVAVLEHPDLPSGVRAKVLNAAGILAHVQGDCEQAEVLFEESLALNRKLANKQGIASALNSLGMTAYHEDEYEKATGYYEESLALRRELKDTQGIAISLNNLGGVAFCKQDYAEAARLYSESLALERGRADKQGIASALGNLGEVAVEQGDYARAATLYAESLAFSRDLGDKQGIAVCLEGLAGMLAKSHQPAHAARLFGASEALRERMDTLLPPASLPMYEKLVSTARAQLGQQSWEEAWAAGRDMTIEQAATYASEIANSNIADGSLIGPA